MEKELQNLANKLRQMWGKHPDADLVEQAAAYISEKNAEEAAKKPTPAKKPATKKAAK